jgi:ketopantoate reductase
VNILLVGAGAVGQVYARHLQIAGARVSFLVRPKAAETCAKGLVLYPLARGKEPEPVELQPEAVFTSLTDVAREKWDQVWLCVPADALEDGWLRSIADATKGAVVVALPPGIDAEERIRRCFPDHSIVPALIGMISYQAPLPGESLPRPGIAYLVPRVAPSAFGGEHGREVAALLSRGGCPAKEDQNTGATSAFGSCVLMPNVAALELSGWSIAELRRGPWLAVAAAAARQAMKITSTRLGARAPVLAWFLRGFVLRIVWRVAAWMLPIDLDAYMRHHFTKVGAQTRQLLAAYLRDAQASKLPASDIATLSKNLATKLAS